MFDMFRFRDFVSTGAIAIAAVLYSSPHVEAAGACGDSYKVRSGDTLARIAKRCGETVPSIIAANDQISDPSKLRVGWVLKMPGQVEQTEQAVEKPASAVPTRVTDVSGQIVNSRRCAELHTSDGQVYGLVSPKVLFRSGAVVKVSGAFAQKTACGVERTIVVSELLPAR